MGTFLEYAHFSEFTLALIELLAELILKRYPDESYDGELGLFRKDIHIL